MDKQFVNVHDSVHNQTRSMEGSKPVFLLLSGPASPQRMNQLHFVGVLLIVGPALAGADETFSVLSPTKAIRRSRRRRFPFTSR